jgi:hypothetical protein
MYEALWSLSCDSIWSLTLARVGRASGAEKLSQLAKKYFFDSIDPQETCDKLLLKQLVNKKFRTPIAAATSPASAIEVGSAVAATKLGFRV